MEKNGMLSEAIHFYAKAQYYSQAIKIAINNELDGEIVSLSMAAPKEVAFRSAVYFERKGFFEKAINLYKKAGALKKSNSLAEQHGFTELISADTLEEDSQE
jgi:intraflagellar transport protein 140